MTLMMSSMKQSARHFAVVGIATDSFLAAPIGMDRSLYLASGGDGCIGLKVLLRSQFWHRGISLLKSVIISDSAHQVVGFGDPPKGYVCNVCEDDDRLGCRLGRVRYSSVGVREVIFRATVGPRCSE